MPEPLNSRVAVTMIPKITMKFTGRERSLFQDDVEARREQIVERLHNRRVLVIGGAGSIGAATVHAFSEFPVRCLHVVDQNENNLAELVRDLRSRPDSLSVPDFRALPIDFGSPVMHRFLLEQEPYDCVLNFAALKHVRSEKDTYSLLQMLDTNILKPARLFEWLAEKGGTSSYFCVSTDKAANPVNLMGASKRLMEHVIFLQKELRGIDTQTTSARFANVAFSDGSLLHGFLRRLEKRQPLAVPRDTKRFFVSLPEAGQICLLAAVCSPHKHLLIPRLDVSKDLKDLESVAMEVLRVHGHRPKIFLTDEEARKNMATCLAAGEYPLLVTPLDTTGEKPYEEFLGCGEHAVDVGLKELVAVSYQPATTECVEAFLQWLEEHLANPECTVTKQMITNAVSAVVEELNHANTSKGLDDRM